MSQKKRVNDYFNQHPKASTDDAAKALGLTRKQVRNAMDSRKAGEVEAIPRSVKVAQALAVRTSSFALHSVWQ
jgi:hypothetical protein